MNPTEFWTHKHPSRPSTDMRGYQVSTFEELAALKAKVEAQQTIIDHMYVLVQQINRILL